VTEDESLEEIARMLGGVKITKRTRDHAGEMLASARGQKSNKSSKAPKAKVSAKKAAKKKTSVAKN